jgi:predicted transposase/invertase (TIGR01784 family)
MQYDRIIKENMEPVVLEFLRRMAGLDLVSYQVLNPEIHKTIERTADYVLEGTNAAGQREIVQIEFQTSNDRTMPKRMLLYFSLLYQLYELPVKQFVIYIGEKAMNMEREISLPNLAFSYRLIDLEAVPYTEFLQSDIPELVIMAILADFQSVEPEQIVRQILEKLTELDNSPADMQRHVRQLDIFSILRNLQEEIKNQEKAMGLVLDIRNDLRYQEGKEDGKEEGIRENNEKFILAMLADGIEIERVAKITGLSVKQIQAIKNSVSEDK